MGYTTAGRASGGAGSTDACERRERLLIVDDEPALLRAVSRILESSGLEIESVASGREAMECLHGAAPATFDAIVLDLTMPGMDGAETLAEIRKIDKDIPVLLCSGYPEDVVKERCKGLQYSGMLAKPFELDDLLDTVRDLLDTA